jgi:hypothetical protein
MKNLFDKNMSPEYLDEIDDILLSEQKNIDYDVKEYVIQVILSLLFDGDLFVPEYQRNFIWDEKKQSKFIESIVLGIPIPYLFGANNPDGRIEVLDGAQRLLTLRAFAEDKLRIRGVQKLEVLNGLLFSNLPLPQQRKFRSRSLRMIVLSEKAETSVRFDLFERINSGSVTLTPAEYRKGAFTGKFYKFVLSCAKNETFLDMCPVGKSKMARGEHEELALRFFVYAASYKRFKHDVAKFLDDFTLELDASITEEQLSKLDSDFQKMIDFVAKHFPYGFRKSLSRRDTPRVRFEAISVGTLLALRKKPNLIPGSFRWLNTKEFSAHTTTHASNSGPRLSGRIEFVRDKLLDNSK